MSVADLCFPC